jgi:hypothetical protein
VKDDKSLRLAIQQCQTYNDCKRVLILLYLVFDFLPNYHIDMSTFIQRIHNVTILEPPKIGKKRKTQHFLISLISHELNTQRKTLVDHAKATLGLTFQLKRVPGTFKASDPKRKKRHIYPWMITGDLVSHLID